MTDSFSYIIWTIGNNLGTQTIDSTSFAPYEIAGGYNIMNANSYLEKSVGSDFPHYHISIRFQVYIIGTSLDATITTVVDSSIANQIAIINPDGTQYLVGQTYNGLQLSHKQIYFDMNHDITSGATIDIKIQLIQNGVNPF